MQTYLFLLTLSTAILFFRPVTARTVSFNQVDGFEDGTTMQWAGNVNGTVQHIATGGPGGLDDGYLQTSVSLFHLGTKNAKDWTGDYFAAGVEAIEMDLSHTPPINELIQIRILLFGAGGTFASSNRTPILATNTWSHHTFGLATNDLVYVTGGTGILYDTLTNVTTLLIRHDSAVPTLPGNHPPHITATLGIDNVHAVPRRPAIRSIASSNGEVTLAIEELVIGTSNTVQTRASLDAGNWANSTGFVASTTTTNIVVPINGGKGSFRTELP